MEQEPIFVKAFEIPDVITIYWSKDIEKLGYYIISVKGKWTPKYPIHKQFKNPICRMLDKIFGDKQRFPTNPEYSMKFFLLLPNGQQTSKKRH